MTVVEALERLELLSSALVGPPELSLHARRRFVRNRVAWIPRGTQARTPDDNVDQRVGHFVSNGASNGIGWIAIVQCGVRAAA